MNASRSCPRRMRLASIASWFERHRIEAGIFLLAFALRFALLGINMHFAQANIEEVVGRFDGSTLGGHLLEAHVRPTLEIVMVESPKHLRRKFDPASGLALLDFGSETAADGS